MPPRTIAIDGPAGSGKTVIGLWLAGELGYTFLDTGVLYRAVTWLALDRGVSASDAGAVAELCREMRIDVLPPNGGERGYRVLVDGRDVTEALFDAVVNDHVSAVSAHPPVREALLPIQRRIAAAGRVVMVGRDIGTVVLPGAQLKLYLDASEEERARRRWRQEREQGGARSPAEVLADVQRRDDVDRRRAASPLRPAEDAHVLRTDNLSLDDEKRRILTLVASHQAAAAAT